jgi:NADH-quinone oxidoreductase subunit F
VIPVRPIYRPDAGRPSVLNEAAIESEGDSPLNRDTPILAK